MDRLEKKQSAIAKEKPRLHKIFKAKGGKNCSLAQILSRPELTYQDILQEFPEDVTDYGPDINRQIELEIKYAGYIHRQNIEIEKLQNTESIKVPQEIDYNKINGLRTEAKMRLSKVRPCNLGQASRIPGIAPSDISVLMIAFKTHAAR